MAAEYTILRSGIVRRNADQAFIPADPLNTDYQLFLVWRAAGGVADHEGAAPPTPTAQLTARIEFKARTLEQNGKLLEAYALRNKLKLP